MKQHRFDALSFVFGAVFLIVAVVFSVPGLDIDVDALRWGAAALLLVIGGGLILGSRRRSNGRDNAA